MRRVTTVAGLVLFVCVALASCISVGEDTLKQVEKLTDTVNDLGGKVKEISDDWRDQVQSICDDGLRKADEAQTAIAEACEGIVEAEKKRKCQDFNRRQKELLETIRRECEAQGQ